jgi:hypothetical protein
MVKATSPAHQFIARGGTTKQKSPGKTGALHFLDGTVARVCAEAQRRFWIPPDLSGPARASKWR